MSASSPFVLLSFDAEEFDLPRENGVKLSLEEAVRVSEQGVSVILGMLEENDVQATFFCTSNFATHAHDAVRRMLSDGHEVASHGCDHWRPAIGDAALSKNILETNNKPLENKCRNLILYVQQARGILWQKNKLKLLIWADKKLSPRKHL